MLNEHCSRTIYRIFMGITRTKRQNENNLTWTNVEMKRNKSKATRKRDRKRHEQYIEQKKVTENNKETEIKETNTNNIEYSSSVDDSDSTDSEMDTIQNIKNPCSTPSQVNREDENQSINTTKDIPVVDNQHASW